MRKILLTCLAACILVACGCGRSGPQTAEELAAALRQQGIAYDVSETAALPRIHADGIRLIGRDLKVEIYCIEDERELKLAVAAAALAVTGQSMTSGTPTIRPYVKKPFLVIVRQEPQDGPVKSALERIFSQ